MFQGRQGRAAKAGDKIHQLVGFEISGAGPEGILEEVDGLGPVGRGDGFNGGFDLMIEVDEKLIGFPVVRFVLCFS